MVNIFKINTSRDYDCCRYFDLIKRIEQFYADNVITDEELKNMNDMRAETLINYQVATEMLHNMKPESKDYAKMTELVDYLRRCWQMMDYATQKGSIQNKTLEVKEKPTTRKNKKEMTLNVSGKAALLVATLATPRKRREANADYISSSVAKLPKDVKDKAMLKVTRALEMLEREKMQEAIQRMATMENTRN